MSLFGSKNSIVRGDGENLQNEGQHQMLPRKRHANLSPPPPNGSNVFRERGYSCNFNDSSGNDAITLVKRTRSSEYAETNMSEEDTRARAPLHASFDSSLINEEGSDGAGSTLISSKKRSNMRHPLDVSEEDTMNNYFRFSDCESEINEDSGFGTSFGIGESTDYNTQLNMNMSSQNQVIRSSSCLQQMGYAQQSFVTNGDGNSNAPGISEISTFAAAGQSLSLNPILTRDTSRDHITPTDLKSELIMTASDDEQRSKTDRRNKMNPSKLLCSSLRKNVFGRVRTDRPSSVANGKGWKKSPGREKKIRFFD